MEYQCDPCQKNFKEERTTNLNWAICPLCGGTARPVLPKESSDGV